MASDAVHVFVGCHGAGDLDELDEEKHRDPGELDGGPDGEEEGVGVGIDDAAEEGGEEITLLGGIRNNSRKVWDALLVGQKR